jgi:DNA-binding NarL/FixJ family response regulator
MEEQIIQLLIEGKTQPEIANEIGKSLSYVEKCLKVIRLKHGCKTMFELGYSIKK